MRREYTKDDPNIQSKLSATDALADLKEIEFRDVDDDSIINDKLTGLEIIKKALEHIGIELDFKFQLCTWEKYLISSTLFALTKFHFIPLRFIKQGGDKTEIMSCHAVIETVLKNYNVTFKQYKGKYQITNIHELNCY